MSEMLLQMLLSAEKHETIESNEKGYDESHYCNVLQQLSPLIFNINAII